MSLGNPPGTQFRVLFELRRIPTNVIPRRPRTDEEMHLDLNTWIAIDTTKGDTMHLTVMSPTQRRATCPAEA